jgi:opacity protein-like surface antigen
MKRLLFVVSLIVLTSLSAMAQNETPRVEVFGGYSYAGASFHGWNASVTGNVNRWFGVMGDFSGYYGSSSGPTFEERQRAHTYMVGPKFSLRTKRVIPFTYALIGGLHIKLKALASGQQFSASDTGLSFAVGGGLDVKINDSIAVRTFQIDYLRTNLFDESVNRGRLSVGIVLSFGKK